MAAKAPRSMWAGQGAPEASFFSPDLSLWNYNKRQERQEKKKLPAGPITRSSAHPHLWAASLRTRVHRCAAHCRSPNFPTGHAAPTRPTQAASQDCQSQSGLLVWVAPPVTRLAPLHRSSFGSAYRRPQGCTTLTL